MKATVPCALCAIALLYCCWRIHRIRSADALLATEGKVEIVVHGPDGTTIPAVGRAPR